MSTTDDLKRKVQSLEDQLKAAKASLAAALISDCGFKVGDVVIYEFWLSKEPRQITRMESKYSDHVQLYGTKKKPNGEWGKRESYIGLASGCKLAGEARRRNEGAGE